MLTINYKVYDFGSALKLRVLRVEGHWFFQPEVEAVISLMRIANIKFLFNSIGQDVKIK